MLLLLSALLSVLLQFDSIAADEIDFETLSSLPPEVRIDFANSPLAKRYQLSAHINPFYLHRDGDGRQDTAILLKKRATGKNGIAIYRGKTNRLVIIGAGRDWGDGGDDFPGLNARYVFQRAGGGGRHGKKPPKLRGDALMVNQTDSASALIYWDGKRYGWYQQGD